ncbi:MAG: aldose 1-epimerase family protein [Actinobacteria bacterium]|nr:aldose 1-epimerase family protein [Actinomycetota bacterium]
MTAGPVSGPRVPPCPPTGAQYEIRHRHDHAILTEVGAGIRTYTIDGTDILDGYGPDQPCDDARGQLLIPWPNRVASGRYRWRDRDHQLDLTEPELGHAIHGLTRWQPWHQVEHTPAGITLATILAAHPGWPHVLACRQTYQLHDNGLTSTTAVTNIGATACPFALGAHPYLRADTPTINLAAVTVPAATYLPTDTALIPTGQQSVQGTIFDLRQPHPLGAREIDLAYTDLDRDHSGRARVSLHRRLGDVQLWFDSAFGYVEIYTAHDLTDLNRRRGGLGIEPMTAPPNAFQTGQHIVTLDPGDSHQASWGITIAPRRHHEESGGAHR